MDGAAAKAAELAAK